MIKAILFALLFVVVGLVVVPLLAPLIFHGGDMRKIGAASFPIILVVGGVAGFAFGWRRNKKS
jgi:hypothetical protein